MYAITRYFAVYFSNIKKEITYNDIRILTIFVKKLEIIVLIRGVLKIVSYIYKLSRATQICSIVTSSIGMDNRLGTTCRYSKRLFKIY